MERKELFFEKWSLGKFLLVAGMIAVFSLLITLKIGGASALPVLVEKDGYCKLTFGEKWNYEEDKNICYTHQNGEKIIKLFTDLEFRNVCPQNHFLSTKFYSNCFHKGNSRS